ncbi:MAG: right-handed parallel beta-helix repeat-containing protein [Deltaproteobacteria bacterium]|nr:right-handed parallel beta-helix repeat-containing protein [Deltaproteobacteria bacterium]
MARVHLRSLSLIFLVAVLSLISVSPARAVDIEVTNNADSGAGTLRQAIADAGDSDTISFTIAGSDTITIASELLINSKSVAINGTNIATGNPITVQVTTPGSSAFRVFNISGQEPTVTIANMIIKGGDVRTTPANGAGIALSNDCSLNLDTVTISDGFADSGGGIFNNYGYLSMQNCTISGNSAANYGGGIFNNYGHLSMQNCTISGNSAISHGGGGISNDGTATIQNCTIYGNSANIYGGGIRNHSTATVQNCTISGNSLEYYGGGGIFNDGTATVRNTILAGNTAGGSDGADYYNDSGGTLTDDGYNVVENQFGITYGQEEGYTFTAATDILYNEESWQQGPAGPLVTGTLGLASILADNGGPTLTLALESTSFAAASATTGIPPADNWNSSPEIDELYSDQRGVARTAGQNTSIGAYSANYSTTPAYYYRSRTSGNWSETSTWQQSENGSEWEDTETIPDTTSLGTTIQTGHTVTVNQDVTTDQTTVENGATLAVAENKTLTIADGDGSDLTVTGTLTKSGTGTITCASGSTVTYNGGNQNVPALAYSELSFADSTSGATKTFANGTTSVGSEISLPDSLTLTGSSAEAVTVQVTTPGEDGTPSRTFHVNAPGNVVTISDLSIKGGDIHETGDGGAVYLEDGSLNLERVSLSDGKGFLGGGILTESGTTLTMTDSIGKDNIATSSGGFLHNWGTATINRCSFFNNTAITGGFVHNNYGDLTVFASTISANTATGNIDGSGGGGAVLNTLATVRFINSTVTGNSAGRFGAIVSFGGNLILVGSTISGNMGSTIDNEPLDGGYGLMLINNNTIITDCIVAYNHENDNSGYKDISKTNGTIYGNYNIAGDWNTEWGGSGNIAYTYTAGKGAPLFAAYDTIVADTIYAPVMADNGGPTETVALSGDAIASETGVKVGFYDDEGVTRYAFYNGSEWVKVEDGSTPVSSENMTEITTDQRGANRHATPSVGAYEIYRGYITNGIGSDWSTAGNWNIVNGIGEELATVAPTAANSTSITVNHDMTVNADLSIDQTSVASAKTLTVAGAKTLTIADGDGTDLTVNGTLAGAGNLTVPGQLLVNGTSSVNIDGTFNATGGAVTFTGAGSLNLGGSVTSLGAFTAGSSTVTYAGTNQTVPGSVTYYNLTKTAATVGTLTFQAESTTTVTGTLRLEGASGQLLSLRSSTPETQWNIDPQSTRTIAFVDVQDSNNTNAQVIYVADQGCVDSGDNSNWIFEGPPPSPPSAQVTVVGGSGSGNYQIGSFFRITADPPPPGMVFSHWSGSTVGLFYVNKPSTLYWIRTPTVNLTAVYTAVPVRSVTMGIYPAALAEEEIADAFSGEIIYIAPDGNGNGVEPCYSTLAAALAAASAGAEIRLTAGYYSGEIIFNQDVKVKISGGWNQNFSAREGVSQINGRLQVLSGEVALEGVTFVGEDYLTINDPAPGITYDTLYVAPDGIGDGTAPCYSSLSAALAAASAGTEIRLAAGYYIDDVIFNRDIAVKISGGWNHNFSARESASQVNGQLQTIHGKMTLEGVSFVNEAQLALR